MEPATHFSRENARFNEMLIEKSNDTTMFTGTFSDRDQQSQYGIEHGIVGAVY